MSMMSELHAEITEITLDEHQAVSHFQDPQQAHRWGMLTASQVLLAVAEGMHGEHLETLLWANEAILEAVKMTRPEG